MARAPIENVGEEPTAIEDIRWKREVQRVLTELIARQDDDRSELDYLKGLG